MVMETYDEDAGYSNISYKATYTDLDPESETFLYILGGGPSGMDKHADIEVWPWQMYIAEDAEDPDVSAQGSTVAVVYSQDGDVKCKASDDDGENWVESTVDTGAGYPCVYVACNMIYVAYVQAENLYLVKSDDLGQSWSSPDQINDESGTVVAESGTADLGVFGITWTDSRDVSYDVYFEYIELDLNNNPPGAPTITGPPKGAAGTKYDYTFTSIDPDGNQVSYYIKWGDGDITDWTAFQASGPPGYSDSHTWDEQDEYTIEAKAKDVCGAESGWATLTVTMPRNRAYINTPFLRFLQQHPNLLPILRLLFQR
jgi:hypothetical protein